MTDSPHESSKLNALKSTSVLAGASAIVMVIRMVRTKVLAVLLGPAGVGLESLFDSVVTMVRTVAELGLSSSGVRQIAAATGDSQRTAVTISVLLRLCLALGVLGALALLLGREWASLAAFDDLAHATAFGWLAIAVLCGVVAAAYGAHMQGMRRIGDLARMNILGTLLGAVVSIPVVYLWGQEGIPAYMVIGAAVGLITAWYYARKVPIERPRIQLSQMVQETRGLLVLGIAFMLMALLATGATFLVRAIVTRQFGLDGAGQFQAANALSMVYIGFVLAAMGTDFYPRLTAVANDNAQCNRVVNEQAEISLVLALPGVLGTIALAPWVIHVFYTGGFSAAAGILVWQMAGMLLRVISWPLGFIALAKGRSSVFLSTDIAAWSTYVALSWVGIDWFGLQGVGVAFFGLYVFHAVMMYVVARHLSGFRWDTHYLRHATMALFVLAAALWMRLAWPEPWATVLPCVLAALATVYSLRALVSIVGFDEAGRVLARFRLGWLAKLLAPSVRN